MQLLPLNTLEASQAAMPLEVEGMSWSVRPWQKNPQKLIVVFAIAIIAGYAGIAIFHQLLMGILGAAMILGATAEYWLGSRFELSAKGAKSQTGLSITELAWPDVKRILINESKVQLSPLEKESRLDAFRGVFLSFDEGNREAILSKINLMRETYGTV